MWQRFDGDFARVPMERVEQQKSIMKQEDNNDFNASGPSAGTTDDNFFCRLTGNCFALPGPLIQFGGGPSSSGLFS